MNYDELELYVVEYLPIGHSGCSTQWYDHIQPSLVQVVQVASFLRLPGCPLPNMAAGKPQFILKLALKPRALYVVEAVVLHNMTLRIA